MASHFACRFLILIFAIALTLTEARSESSASRYIIRKSPDAMSVIVFVHGIFGDSSETWTNANGTYWPTLLKTDPFFSEYDVYVYEYPSRFVGGNFSIDEIAENVRLLFEADQVADHKEIIFVTHSMGGLVTRAYLNRNPKVSERVRLIYFFSTPTTGSEITSIGALVSTNPGLAKMKPMTSESYLGDLQRQWLNVNNFIPSFCAYEKRTTYGVNVVTQQSASNLCNRRLDPIDADHMTIVKPDGPRDNSFLALKSAIQATPRKSADAIKVFGKLADAITSLPIAGAKIEIEYAGQIIGSGTSEEDGTFKTSLTVPQPTPLEASLVLSVRAQNYESSKGDFKVRTMDPAKSFDEISMLPLELTRCKNKNEHSIIIGHFVPPIHDNFSELSLRIARTLNYALTTRLQTVHLAEALQPSFEPCEDAWPKTDRLGASFAKALRADAFINGDISDGPSRFTVNTYVSDAYDLFQRPVVSTNRKVDLSNPRSDASIAAETHTAVLAALAAGLAGKGDCRSAIAVLSVAEQFVRPAPSYVSRLRKGCETRLPNGGLTSP
jgi:pimeloyl-ACP methyl ester carboxylesterase